MTMASEIYGDDVIQQYWHVDGPHSDVTTREAGRALAELVRFLNHATGPDHARSALPYASLADSLVGSLASAVDGMHQLLNQIGHFLETQANDPSLVDDRRDPDRYPAHVTAITAAEELEHAAQQASALLGSLKRAKQHALHLGNEDTPQPAVNLGGMDGEDLG